MGINNELCISIWLPVMMTESSLEIVMQPKIVCGYLSSIQLNIPKQELNVMLAD